MVQRRRVTVFSLSFLDVMSCGFGAVVLVFLIINHATHREFQESNSTKLASVSMINREVTMGQQDLARLRELLDGIELELQETRSRANTAAREIDQTRRELARLRETDSHHRQTRAQLKSDIERLEQEVARLRSTRVSEDEVGQATRTFIGEGKRQYLTGINVSGNRIAIAVDSSASMLADTLVNVIRRRNMSDERKRASDKWRRAVRTVDWITAQIPLDAQFQVLTFNDHPGFVLPESEGKWLDAAGGSSGNRIVEALEQVVPAGGSSLYRLFEALNAMRPQPDTLFLITDSLPTVGKSDPRRGTVSGRDRVRLFDEALKRWSSNVPVNVILFPLEGDPMAAAEYWQLAVRTRGAFLSPSRDWP